MSATPHRRILASAGTGKTYQLASRYLELVLDGADPRTILATTFTRAAAAEIRDRILTTAARAVLEKGDRVKLAARTARSELSLAESERLLRELVENLRHLQVRTLDSTFAGIASAAAPELGLPEGLGILESDDDAGLEQRALAHALDSDDKESLLGALEALGKGGASARSVVDLLQRIVDRAMLTYRDSDGRPGPWLWARREDPPELDVPEVITRLRASATRREEELGKSDQVSKDIELLASSMEEALHAASGARMRLEEWAKLLRKGVAAKLHAGESKFHGIEIDDPIRAVVQPLVDHMHALAIADYATRTASTYLLLHNYAQAREAIRSQLGVATFADVVRLLRQESGSMLSEEIWFRLDARVRHLMLDEFQDTSLEQWKVLRPLAEEIVSDFSGERTFFCVGDVKQSIYGWRGGLPGILEHLQSMILESGADARLDDATLVRSYRSAPEVLEAVNLVFGSIGSNPAIDERGRGAAEAMASFWGDHEAALEGLEGCVEMRVIESDSPKAVPMRRAGARDAAQLAAELHEQLPGSSIGVLATRNDVVGQVVARLRTMGVNASADAGGSFLDSGATVVMLDALHLAERPGRRTAAFNVLHSPLAPILAMSSMEEASLVSRRLRQGFTSGGIATTVETWVDRLRGSLDARETVRVQRFVLEIERLERGGEQRPERIARLLERMRLDEPGDDAVRVMTIHKAKGLEFDVVIVTGLDDPLFRHAMLASERVMPPGDVERVIRWTNQGVLPPEFEPLHEATRIDAVRERLCQLYVAMTRARRGLFLLVGPPPDPKKDEKSSMAGVLRGALSGYGVDEAEPNLLARLGRRSSLAGAPDGSPEETPREREAPAFEINLDATGTTAAMRAAAPSSKAGSKRPIDALAIDGGEAAEIGTAWHYLLECVEWIEAWEQGGAPDRAHLGEELAREMPGRAPEWYEARVEGFLASLVHPHVRDALSRSALGPGVGCRLERELRWVSSTPEGALREGVIDRVLLEEGSGAHRQALVVDWKTDQVASGAHAAHAERYRGQLEAYGAAVAALEGLAPERIGLRVVFVRDGEAVQLVDGR